MGNIGLLEIVLALLLIGGPVWAMRGFPIPQNRVVRYVLFFGLTALVTLYVYNWATPFRVMNESLARTPAGARWAWP